jgi:hypothetical protein
LSIQCPSVAGAPGCFSGCARANASIARQRLGDALHGRIGRVIDLEEARARRLAHQAEVRHRDAVAMRELSGLLVAREMPFERGKALVHPVLDPFHPRRLIELELMLEEIAHARHDQRMRVGR